MNYDVLFEEIDKMKIFKRKKSRKQKPSKNQNMSKEESTASAADVALAKPVDQSRNTSIRPDRICQKENDSNSSLGIG